MSASGINVHKNQVMATETGCIVDMLSDYPVDEHHR